MNTETARRVLHLEGASNFRDLGGYDAGDRQVRWGLLYRSADISALSGEDRIILERRNIRTLVDFRTAVERDRAPDRDIPSVVGRYWLPIETGNIVDLASVQNDAGGEALMRRLYTVLVRDCRSQYRDFFALLSAVDAGPLLFHCSAGKDRTGFAAALLLSALGVHRETIYEDYLLSAACLRLEGTYADLIRSAPYLEPILSARRSYLEAAFGVIDRSFGGIEAYLEDELGADSAFLRKRYTVERPGEG